MLQFEEKRGFFEETFEEAEGGGGKRNVQGYYGDRLGSKGEGE